MADKDLYHIPFLSFLLILIVALHAACNTFDSDYERDNPKDPKNPVFVHSKPDWLSITVEGEEIIVTWKDNTIYNDGYLIEKAIDDSTRFEHFASLPKDAEGFFDRSRKIGLRTFYRISTVEIENGDEKIVHSEILSLSVNVLNWFHTWTNFIDEFHFRGGITDNFIDGLRLEEKSPHDSTYTTISDLDKETIFKDDIFFQFKSEIKTFKTNVRFVAYQYHGDKKVDIDYYEKTLNINEVTSVSAAFISETETLINWVGNYDFADHYLLEVYRGDTKVGEWEMPPTGSYMLDLTNSPGWSTYRVTGKHKGIETNPKANRIHYYYYPPSMSIESSNLDEVYISWTDPANINNGTKPSGFTVERSTNDYAYEEIAVLPVDQFAYVDRDLDPGNTYKYRVQTMSSTSNELRIRSMNLYTATDEEDFFLTRNSFNAMNFQFFDENNAAVYGQLNYLYPVTHLDIDNLSVLGNFDSGNKAYDFTLSPDGNRAVELVDGNTPGGYNLNIWNIETSSLETVFRDVYVNTTISYLPAIARYSPSGEHIAIGELNTETAINFYNAVTGEIDKTLEVPGEDLRAFFFNPHANEIVVFSRNWILMFDVISLKMNRQIPINIHIDYRGQLLIPKSGNYLIYHSAFNLYKIDAETGLILDEISFNNSISFISVNNNFTDILVQTHNRYFFISAENFEILQLVSRESTQQGQIYMALNQFLEHNAIAIRRMADNQWKMEKWLRRSHWYAEHCE